MEGNKKITEFEESEELSWKNYAKKQGYLVKFNRGLLKAPKMQYFVLTDLGLISFESRPKHDTEPLFFVPYEQLSSIKLDHVELQNSCKLCCMQLTSKTSPSFTLAFKCKEDRDSWMMVMMKAFSETLLTTNIFDKSSETIGENNASESDDSATKPEHIVSSPLKEKLEQKFSLSNYGSNLRRKRRKGDKGSIRRSKSYDCLAQHDVTNTAFTFPMKLLTAEPAKPEPETAFQPQQSRKRKSEPEINVLPDSPIAETTESKEKLFTNACAFEHNIQSEKPLKSKHEAKHKTSMFLKLRSKFENPALVSH